jgi:anhydro-N-acetylmuramic acid kinase
MGQNLNNNGRLRILGIMSGTSLDGLDFCLVDFTENQSLEYEIKACKTVAYPQEWTERLTFSEMGARDLHQLDEDYARYLAQQVLAFIESEGLDKESINLIASHGHTWFHEPHKGISLQIGNRPILATLTGLPLICDFRVQDVALGGQGAPLVPIGDRDLFGNYQACLNLGGFANISLDANGERIAWDIGPCNLPMNHYCRALGLKYDAEGVIAATYGVDDQLFRDLNALPYYQQLAPKSLGREWVDQELLPLIDRYAISPELKIATLNRHIAWQIAQSLKSQRVKEVLISGGGSYNTTLISAIESMGDFKLHLAEPILNDSKEALIFAYLAYLQQQGKPNVLASVTGAQKDHCSGIRYNP